MVVDVTMAVDNQKRAEIGARMKAAREALSLTQDGLAKAVGASKRGIQDNEAQKSVPGGEVVAGLVRLGINANWLLTGEGPMLIADLALPVAATKINVDALEAIIEGTIKALPRAAPDAIARQAVGFYVQCIEKDLITPEGIGDGNLNAAA